MLAIFRSRILLSHSTTLLSRYAACSTIKHFNERVIGHYENPRYVGSRDKYDCNIKPGIVGASACGNVPRLQIKVDDEEKMVDTEFKFSSLAKIKGRTLEYATQAKSQKIIKGQDIYGAKTRVRAKIRPIVTAFIVDHFLRVNFPRTPMTNDAAELTSVTGVLLEKKPHMAETNADSSEDGVVIKIVDCFPTESGVDEGWLGRVQSNLYPQLRIVGFYRTTLDEGEPMEEDRIACERLQQFSSMPIWLGISCAAGSENKITAYSYCEDLERMDATSLRTPTSSKASDAFIAAEILSSNKNENIEEQVLRCNLLSLATPNPMRRWRDSVAHKELQSGQLQRPWLGLGKKGKFWRVDFRNQTDSNTDAAVSIRRAHQQMQDNELKGAARTLDLELKNNMLNVELLIERGKVAEMMSEWILAERFYCRVLHRDRFHKIAIAGLERIRQQTERAHNSMLVELYKLVDELVRVPRCNPLLRKSLKEAFLQGAHSTLAIEGNTMTIEETTEMLLEVKASIENRSYNEQAEVRGWRDAVKFLVGDKIKIGEITLENLLEIHRRVVGQVDGAEKFAGILRTHTPSPNREVRAGSLVGAHSTTLPQLMDNLLEFINSQDNLRKIDIVELAAYSHLWMVTIHPFKDGNGRATRLLMDYFLLKAGLPAFIVPADKELRRGYYSSLVQASLGSDREFILFMISLLSSILSHHVEETKKFALQ